MIKGERTTQIKIDVLEINCTWLNSVKDKAYQFTKNFRPLVRLPAGKKTEDGRVITGKDAKTRHHTKKEENQLQGGECWKPSKAKGTASQQA